MLREYSELPDYMTVEELEEYFIKLLDYSMKSKDIDNESISEALYELSDRQWHTYELINETIKEKIEQLIDKVWNTKFPDLIDNITSVIAMLGLVKSFELVKRSIEEDVSYEVKEIY